VRYASAPERRRELLRRVTEDGYVSCAEAASALGVSEMTIRRDLGQLAAQGLVTRVAGGASRPLPAAGEPFEQRSDAATRQKRAIARAAVALVAGDEVIALDAGTTVAELAALLPGGRTVVTHSVPVITACTARDDLDLIALGGAYHPPTRSFTGPLTRAGLADLAVDVAVLSATAAGPPGAHPSAVGPADGNPVNPAVAGPPGAHPTAVGPADGNPVNPAVAGPPGAHPTSRTAAGPPGAYSANATDADVKRAMAAIAGRVILLLDHTKIGARAPMRFIGLAAVDTVVVDEGVAVDQLAMLRECCRQVVVAPL
jgi:DeoR/GlpR family transcriptional regulator of sugar metabolism